MDGQRFLSEFLEAGMKMAQDTKKDGFATLTDKNGNTYVAQMNESEKERYKETGKKLSQVKKERKEQDNTDKEFEDYIKQLKSVASQPNKGLFGGRIKYYKNILKDIEKQGLKSMAEVNELLKSKYPGFVQVKQPEEKQSNRDDVIKYFTRKGLKPWRDERVYLKDLAKELLNLDTDYYKTGNLHSFSWYDGRETNTRGRKILKAVDSSYFDLNNGNVVVPYSRFEYEDDIADQVRNKYSEALTETLGKIDVTKRAEPEKIKPSDTTGKKSLDIETYTEKLRQRVNTKSAIGESEYLRAKLQPLREKALEYIEKNKPTKEQYLEWFEKSGLKAEAIKIKAGENQPDGGKGSDIDKYLDKWNGKVYKYKDGTKAIFSNNQKIILTDEQFEYLQSKSK